jgi:hypothetical protein
VNSRGIKAKGRNAETAVVEYMRANGWPIAERRRLAGVADMGDVAGVHGVVLEVKAEKRIVLASYMDELAAEIMNAERTYGYPHIGAAVVKRRGTLNAGEWYAVLPFREYLALLKGHVFNI